MSLKSNYYFNTFFWSTLQKVLAAIANFISIPLLLALYGKETYGILGVALSCNAYVGMLDLGIGTGAVRFFSKWRAEGKIDRIYRVAHSNSTFYLAIAIVNVLFMFMMSVYCDKIFSVTSEQVEILRKCLLIIGLFSIFGWLSCPYSQLLTSDMQQSFNMRWQVVQTILKLILVYWAIKSDMDIVYYFFFVTLFSSMLIVPSAYKCYKDRLIDSFKFSFYWDDFKEVLSFSLALFALSLFQMLATQSRPFVLSVMAENGPTAITEFNILGVVPQFILMLGFTFSSMFLPKTSDMVGRNDVEGIHAFVYKWTRFTSIYSNVFCFPFIICAQEVISAYVGSEYKYLAPWLIIWCITVLVQIHTTPANSVVLAYGKTKVLVVMTIVTCIISIIINVVLCEYFGVGSAIIGYFIYVCIIIGTYYLYFYKTMLNLSRIKMLLIFIKPTFVSVAIALLLSLFDFSSFLPFVHNERVYLVICCIVKTVCWLIPYIVILLLSKYISIGEFKMK